MSIFVPVKGENNLNLTKLEIQTIQIKVKTRQDRKLVINDIKKYTKKKVLFL